MESSCKSRKNYAAEGKNAGKFGCHETSLSRYLASNSITRFFISFTNN
jgi:hypothetical protein